MRLDDPLEPVRDEPDLAVFIECLRARYRFTSSTCPAVSTNLSHRAMPGNPGRLSPVDDGQGLRPFQGAEEPDDVCDDRVRRAG